MTRPTFNPRTARIAAAIHYYAKPLGWDCTIADLADATGESPNAIRAVLHHNKWLDRVRRVSPRDGDYFAAGTSIAAHSISGRYLAEAVAAGKVGAE
jgi:hypothetical protein